jgi:methylglutaconyl-CoA hydratase
VSAVRSTTDDRKVTQLTIDRPERKNAFDARVIAELTAIAKAVPSDARAIVLASAGDTFCAGADVEWMRSMADYTLEENVADSARLAGMFAALYALEVPLIARVQGAAVGGGAGLVAVADIAVASTDASFAFTETRLGILPAVVSPYVVRKIGPARATALFVTGSRIDAKRAHEIGLVGRVVERSDLDAAIGRVVDAILEAGPQATKEAKRLVREVEGRPIADVVDLTIERIAALRVTPEAQKRMRAFLDRKRG